MKKLFLFSFIALLITGAIGVDGVSAQSAQTQATLAAQLGLQIQNIRTQVNQLIAEQGTNYPVLNRPLAIGARGDDVEVIQALLAADMRIYPQGLITGYYGPLTTSAVSRFQASYGLPVTGRVDIATLTALRAYQAQIGLTVELDASNNMRPCYLRAVAAATAAWVRNGVGIVSMCQAAASGSVPTGGTTGTSVAGAFTTNTTLSGLFGSALTPNSITLNWNNSGSATNRVFLSTTSPVNTAAATVFSTTSATANPSVNLTGLAPNTRYYYVVETRDLSGNVTRSAEYTFMTPAATTSAAQTPTNTAGATTTNPLSISGISSTNLTTSGATINWTTNMNATSRIFYSSCPFNMNNATSVSANSSNTNQSITISGLASNTTYCYVIQSTDANGNVVTAGPSMFVTTANNTNANNTGNGPTVSGFTISPSANGAVITWTTGSNATSRIYYSTTSPVDKSTAQSVFNFNPTSSQSLTLGGLSPNTTYYVLAESVDANGNVTTTTQQFTTTQ